MSFDEIDEMIKRLRKGEDVKCPICKKGKMKPVGNYKTTKGFYCDSCGKKLSID